MSVGKEILLWYFISSQPIEKFSLKYLKSLDSLIPSPVRGREEAQVNITFLRECEAPFEWDEWQTAWRWLRVNMK